MHVFEKAGLGKAPFRFVDVEERRGPLSHTTASGVTVMVGAPGQAMGTCQFCGQGIALCCHILSADGKRFIVGSDCVRKTGDAGITKTVDREVRRRTKAAEGQRIEAAKRRLAEDDALREAMGALPSPNAQRPQDSALDWAHWMYRAAGHTGQLKVTRFIEKH